MKKFKILEVCEAERSEREGAVEEEEEEEEDLGGMIYVFFLNCQTNQKK